MQNFVEKQKCLNLGPKLPYLVILGLDFENNIVLFEISTFNFATFLEIMKTPKFGTKNALFV